MVHRVKVPDSEKASYERTVHASFFNAYDITGKEAGLVHEEERITDGKILAGTRFGGTFEIIDGPLTKTQTRILGMLAMGVNVSEVAELTSTSINTVRTHIKLASMVLGTGSIAASVNRAFSGPNAFFVPVEYGGMIPEISMGQRRIIAEYIANPTNREELADKLQLSPATVTTHFKHIYDRLEVAGDHHVSIVTMAHLTDTVINHAEGAVIELGPAC